MCEQCKGSMHKITIEIHSDTIAWLRDHKWVDVSIEGYVGAMVDNEVRRRVDAENAANGIDPDLPEFLGGMERSHYSLSEIIEANEVVKKYNDERTDTCVNLVMDDRYIAAIYTLSHYPAKHGEAVVIDSHKALLVLPLPKDYFNEGED